VQRSSRRRHSPITTRNDRTTRFATNITAAFPATP